MSTEDRRAPGATRIPFDGIVEVGGALGPSFEAQAVNVSEEGMLLRTAYLPEPGQPLTCRFDAGPGKSVLASGEVVWTVPAEKGGEFAIRFTEMDGESAEAIKRACGIGEEGSVAQPGSKVRLHIEGLASPMRAKIKDSHVGEVTVGSDLGFLQVGKQLELEDAQSGNTRPASIDRVDVAIDPNSHVPQLVVTLRYADVDAGAEAEQPRCTSDPARQSAVRAVDDLAAVEDASAAMKGALARNFARVAPAFERFANRTKTTVALLAAPTENRRGRQRPAPPNHGARARGRTAYVGSPRRSRRCRFLCRRAGPAPSEDRVDETQGRRRERCDGRRHYRGHRHQEVSQRTVAGRRHHAQRRACRSSRECRDVASDADRRLGAISPSGSARARHRRDSGRHAGRLCIRR